MELPGGDDMDGSLNGELSGRKRINRPYQYLVHVAPVTFIVLELLDVSVRFID